MDEDENPRRRRESFPTTKSASKGLSPTPRRFLVVTRWKMMKSS